MMIHHGGTQDAERNAKFPVSDAPGPIAHKSDGSYSGAPETIILSSPCPPCLRGEPSADPPCAADPAIAQFFAALTPRQVRVAAAHLDGLTQADIARRESIDQGTVSRDIEVVRQTCRRHGRELPEPMRLHARRERQVPEAVAAVI